MFWPHYRRYWQPWLCIYLKTLFWNRFEEDLPPRAEVAGCSTYVELIDKLPHAGPTSELCRTAYPGEDKRNISKPVLFFASADDPFHPIDAIGIDTQLPHVLYYVTETGGHVAWPEGWRADCSSFHARVVLEFFNAHVA